ncbi:MAG: hypothetical protein GXP31_17395 [Kiritimatiellaeota bacterium]|nr:hypothetical protein [Kiritimatiellota bacterium]
MKTPTGGQIGILTMAVSCLITPGVDTGAKEARTFSQGQYLRLMNKALDGVIDKCRNQPRHELVFSANLFFAHEVCIKAMPLEILTKYVDALKAAGVNRIDINMGLFPWLNNHEETIGKYDALVRHIRQANLQLAVNPQYSGMYHKFRTFDDWATAALKVYPRIAGRYQPEILVVVHEPTVMNDRMGIHAGPERWRDFVRRAARAIRSVSPRSRCGAGILAGRPSERRYFEAFLLLDELDAISFDIYRISGLGAANKMIPQARKRGKSVYIEETWRPPYYVQRSGRDETLDAISAKGIGDQVFQALDAKWLTAMILYANAWRLEAVTPFWTQTFFKYVTGDGNALDPSYNRQVVEAIKAGEVTKTFDAFKALIQQQEKLLSNTVRQTSVD